MDPWERIIPTFKYSREVPFFEMLVPTTDTVRYGYLMEKLLAVRHSVLFTGTTGVGKVGNTRRKRSAVKSEGTVELGSSAPEITHRFPAEIFRFHHFFKKKLSLQNLYRPGDFPKVYRFLDVSSVGVINQALS